eukprot:2041366-Rhodomonas_salina.1
MPTSNTCICLRARYAMHATDAAYIATNRTAEATCPRIPRRRRLCSTIRPPQYCVQTHTSYAPSFAHSPKRPDTYKRVPSHTRMRAYVPTCA